MGVDGWLKLFVSGLLVLASAFFVATEYSLVGTRRGRIESLAKRGDKRAAGLLKILEDISPYIAATQLGITMLGIAMGSFVEPFITEMISSWTGSLDKRVAQGFSFMIVAFGLVVLGELVPKYWALNSSDKIALRTYRSLSLVVLILKPLIMLAQWTSTLVLRIFGIKIDKNARTSVKKEELLMMVEMGEEEGILDKTHADLVTRALRLDNLSAKDIMIHRLDMKWLDVDADRDTILRRLRTIPYNRLPVCKGDIDELVGIVYLHDIVRSLSDVEFSLAKIVRPLIAVPENLTFERIVQTMRDGKTQMLIVLDEYGGSSGLVTLEDVVEEVFGELEDRIESERPQIETHPNGRVSARAEVRFDELVNRLELELDPGENTDTLATIVMNGLSKVPQPGDKIETILGTMRVENMARRRVTRVSIQLKPELIPVPED